VGKGTRAVDIKAVVKAAALTAATLAATAAHLRVLGCHPCRNPGIWPALCASLAAPGFCSRPPAWDTDAPIVPGPAWHIGVHGIWSTRLLSLVIVHSGTIHPSGVQCVSTGAGTDILRLATPHQRLQHSDACSTSYSYRVVL
jgi:hypothetical protein